MLTPTSMNAPTMPTRWLRSMTLTATACVLCVAGHLLAGVLHPHLLCSATMTVTASPMSFHGTL